MKRDYAAPTLVQNGGLVGTTMSGIGVGSESFTKAVPAGSAGFLL